MSVDSFAFNPVLLEDMEADITRLNPSKATTLKNIPPKILKNNSDIFYKSLKQILNSCIASSTFLDKLQCADVSSLHEQRECRFVLMWVVKLVPL